MDEKIVFQGKIIEIIHKTVISNGKELIFERGRRSPGVRLIIQTPNGEFLISKEIRHDIGLDYRLPGGKVFDSLSEYNQFLANQKNPDEIMQEVREAVVREGIQEVGIKPTEFELFTISHCGGSFEWDLYYFHIKKYEEVGQQLEEHEKIETIKVSRAELHDIALKEMKEERSVAVLFRFLNK